MNSETIAALEELARTTRFSFESLAATYESRSFADLDEFRRLVQTAAETGTSPRVLAAFTSESNVEAIKQNLARPRQVGIIGEANANEKPAS